MASVNMANINMVKVNTLIRKGYLLAGVVMAANMFIVNEVKASFTPLENNTNTKEFGGKEIDKNINIDEEMGKKKENSDQGGNNLNTSATQTGILATLLGKKVFINFLGTFAVSCLNNYFNLWDYKSGKYLDWKFGFFGWRTKRFLNDYLQFEVNLNVYRGLGWGILNMVNYKNQNKISMQLIFRFVTGFISAPLTLHIFNFSIAISIDSIVYGMVEMVNNRWGKNKKTDVEKEENEQGEDLKDIEDLNKGKNGTYNNEEIISDEKNEESKNNFF